MAKSLTWRGSVMYLSPPPRRLGFFRDGLSSLPGELLAARFSQMILSSPVTEIAVAVVDTEIVGEPCFALCVGLCGH